MRWISWLVQSIHCIDKAKNKIHSHRLLVGLCLGRGWESSLNGRALTPLFGNRAGGHGIGKINGVLTKFGKFDIVLMYDVFIARLIPIIKLTPFLDI